EVLVLGEPANRVQEQISVALEPGIGVGWKIRISDDDQAGLLVSCRLAGGDPQPDRPLFVPALVEYEFVALSGGFEVSHGPCLGGGLQNLRTARRARAAGADRTGEREECHAAFHVLGDGVAPVSSHQRNAGTRSKQAADSAEVNNRVAPKL